MTDGSREWDARTYDRVSGPQLEWSAQVIDRLELRGDELVLDAGCGSGRVAEQLLERLPRGRLVGVDASEAMVGEARRRLGERAELICADLLAFEFPEPFDAVFSNATFHWIGDHDALFRRAAGWLRPGGRLEAQCGGEGNVARFFELADRVAAREPYAAHIGQLTQTRNFAGPAETERRLSAAGFERARCGLSPRPTRPLELEAFIGAVCLREHLQGLPEELRQAFVAEVADGLGPDPVLDYVRLDISARR
jgi:trans-aconitate 2-methyltransferase